MTRSPQFEINGDRLLADLRKLATFGKVGNGVDRVAFSDPDIAARRWLVERMSEAGLETMIDGVGNVHGRSPAEGTGVLIGSHTDSVPKGGWLDGSMGVLYGLEIARSVQESDARDTAVVDVISFQDEEGTYFPCLGSKSLCGELEEGEIDQACDANGQSLRDAIARHDLANAPRPQLQRDRYRAYMEAHIEQGPRLEAAAKRIGIVTGIVGIRRFNVVANGQADHAGTTPMPMRLDAGVALIKIAAEIVERFVSNGGPDTVWNIGKMTFEPGAANVVPSRAEMLLEFRDTSPDLLDRLEAIVEEIIVGNSKKGAVTLEAERTAAIPPINMDAELGEKIAGAAQTNGEDAMHMPSGAGHDAMVLARHLPTAMLFVPSIGGRSHDTEEDTSEEDIVLGCRIMAEAVARALSDQIGLND